MGFFAQHTTFNEGSGKKYSTAEAGIYACALVDVEAVQSKSFDDPNVLEPNLKWVFETTEVGDDDGQPFRFVQYTKTSYGNDKAKLTLLLDGMVGLPARLADAGNVNVGVPVRLPPVPSTYLVRKYMILFKMQYCPVLDAPVPGVMFVHDGVNDVNVPMALSSAAVRICPAVNVPLVVIVAVFGAVT